MRASKLLSIASLVAALAVTAVVPSGSSLAQSAPAARQDPHHPGGAAAPPPPPAQGQATPAPGMGGGMPMPGGAMGMMGMMGSGGMPSMMDGMMDHMSLMQMMGERTEGRLAFVKAELAITEAQAAVWNAYADVVRAEAKRRRPGMSMAQAIPAATWVDRVVQHERDLEQRLDALRRLKGVSSALYAALSVPQKKIADELMNSPLGHM